MKITEHLKSAKETLFSIEILPPLKGKGIQSLYKHLDPLMEFKPPVIDVTTSREEYIYIDKGNGLLDKKLTRMRPGTLGICASIKHKYNVDTVPHLLCGGFTKEETEYMLVDCHYLCVCHFVALASVPPVRMHGNLWPYYHWGTIHYRLESSGAVCLHSPVVD